MGTVVLFKLFYTITPTSPKPLPVVLLEPKCNTIQMITQRNTTLPPNSIHQQKSIINKCKNTHMHILHIILYVFKPIHIHASRDILHELRTTKKVKRNQLGFGQLLQEIIGKIQADMIVYITLYIIVNSSQ